MRQSHLCLVAVALLAWPVAGFLILRPDRTRERAEPAPTHGARPSRVKPSPDLSAARSAARGFLAGYLAYVHGRGSTRAIEHTTPQLRRELSRRPARVTPTQESGATLARRLTLDVQAGGGVRALATLHDRGGPPYALLLYLERRASGWTVTRLGDV